MMSSLITTFLSKLILCSLLLSALLACSREERVSPQPRLVKYQVVQDPEESKIRSLDGITKFKDQSTLSFRVSGNINDLPIKVGDRVKKGGLLAQLDPRDYELQLQEAEASLLKAKAQERHAAISYDMYRDLYEARSASRNELDASRAEAESAAAAVEAMQKKLALAQRQLNHTRLQAPVEGSVAALHVAVNENVTSGAPILLLHLGDQLEVEVDVPESLINEISVGDPATVSFAILSGKLFDALVSEVGVKSVGGTSFPVRVGLLHGSDELREGMSARVNFSLGKGEGHPSLNVPSSALFGQGNHYYLYVITPMGEQMGRVERREVVVRGLTSRGVEVVEGLKGGEWIVTAGVQQIHDGEEVKLSM